MKKVKLLLMIAFFVAINFSFSQTTIHSESFEGALNSGYTSSGVFSDGGNDYFDLIGEGADPSGNATYSNVDGVRYWNGEDTQDAGNPNASGISNVTISGIDVSGYTSINILGLFGAGNSVSFDGTDTMQVLAQIDGGGFVLIGAFEAPSGGSNTTINQDTNLDGNGDGTALNTTLQEFVFALGSIGSTLDIRIDVFMTAGGEEIAFDNIRVEGILATTTVQFVSTTSSLTEDGMSIDVCVEIDNEDATNDTTVEIALDGTSTATNGTDYDDGTSAPIVFPQTLTFTAGTNTNQCITIFISTDDLISEGDETVILNLQNASGGDSAVLGGNIQHTLTIVDNETPPTADIVITEIMYNTASTDDEWIEICNVSGSDQDISDYIIDVNGTTEFTFPASTTIINGDCITVSLGSNGDGTYNNACPFTPDFGVDASTNSTNNLNNTGETITVYAADGTTAADAVAYSDADGADGNGSTLHLGDTGLDNSSTGSNWIEVGTGGSPGEDTLVSPCAVATTYQIDDNDGQTIYTCSGTFLDSGGASGDYSDDENYTVTFCSGSASEVLQFIFNPQESDSMFQDHNFEIENGDVLNVYDGTDTTGTLLTTITDTTDPGANHFYLYGISECITFEFISNGSGNDNGWEALISCVPLGCGTNPAPADDFANAPYICDLDGFCATTVGYTEDLPANLTDTGGSCPGPLFGGTIENNSWIQFQAADTSITLEFTVPTCYGAFGAGTPTVSEGIQSAIFEYDGTNFTRVSDCAISDGTNNGTFTLTSSSLVAGNIYYIMTDGSAGSQCDYSINVLNGGNGIALFDAGNAQTICAGTSATLTATGPAGATYSWTSTDPGFGTVVGNPISVSPSATATYTVEITSGLCLSDTDTVVVNVDSCSGGSPLMITQYYEGANENKWIEIKNISGAIVPANTYYLVVLNNADADDPINADPTQIGSSSFNNNLLINTDMAIDEVRRFKEPLAVLPAYAVPGETGYDGNPTFDMSNNVFSGDDLIIISSTNDDTTWANRIDVIGDGTLWGDRRCFIRNECIANGPSITFDINDWIEFTDAEVESPVLNTNPYLGEHFQGVTVFDNTNNWNNGIPDKSRIIQISENYDTTTYGNFSACSVLVDYDKRLTINNSNYVEVQNDITIDGEIWVETEGSLVQNDNSATVTINNVDVNDIPALVNKQTNPLQNWYDYTYWSSPVSGETVSSALATSSPNRRFGFNASLFNDTLAEINNTGAFTADTADDIDDDGDVWIDANIANIMTPGLGYAASHTQIGFVAGVRYTYPFQGTFNTGNIPVQIYVTPVGFATVDYNNWNLIGNPYPSAISADTFFTTNAVELEEVIYLWAHNTLPDSDASGNEVDNFSNADYAIINDMAELPGSDMVTPDRFVSSGQGFFVIGKKSAVLSAGNVTANFNNDMRALDNTVQFFRSNTVNNSNRNEIRLNLTSNNGVSNQMYVGYKDDATNGFDGYKYDAVRNLASGASAILYSVINNHSGKFAIQGRDENLLNLDEIIPLGLKNLIDDAATIFTISIAEKNGNFFSSNPVYLKDNLLNVTHDLTTTDYTFTSLVGEFSDRFEIVFRNNSLSLNDNEINSSSLLILEDNIDNVEFKVLNQTNIKTIKIYDLVGRLVFDLVGNSYIETYNFSSLDTATYFAKVELENNVILTKKFIKK